MCRIKTYQQWHGAPSPVINKQKWQDTDCGYISTDGCATCSNSLDVLEYIMEGGVGNLKRPISCPHTKSWEDLQSNRDPQCYGSGNYSKYWSTKLVQIRVFFILITRGRILVSPKATMLSQVPYNTTCYILQGSYIQDIYIYFKKSAIKTRMCQKKESKLWSILST